MQRKPWLGRAVQFLVKKLKKLFPTKVAEDQVVEPDKPKTMPAEEALAFILHKNIPRDTYRYIAAQTRATAKFRVCTGCSIAILDTSIGSDREICTYF